MFLVVKEIKIIDTPYSPAVKGVKEEKEVRNLKTGAITQIAVSGIEAKAEVPETSHFEIAKAYVETSDKQVAINMAGETHNTKYYLIDFDPDTLEPELLPLQMKTGTKKKAPPRKIVEIEDAAGNVHCSAMVEC